MTRGGSPLPSAKRSVMGHPSAQSWDTMKYCLKHTQAFRLILNVSEGKINDLFILLLIYHLAFRVK